MERLHSEDPATYVREFLWEPVCVTQAERQLELDASRLLLPIKDGSVVVFVNLRPTYWGGISIFWARRPECKKTGMKEEKTKAHLKGDNCEDCISTDVCEKQ